MATALLVPLAYRYADHPVAMAAYRLLEESLGARPEVHDLLGALVLVITLAGLVARCLPEAPPRFAELRAMILLAGVVAPLAFVAKTVLKIACGRVETQLWVTGATPDGFNWFTMAPGFGGFPSGHMTVCIALAAVGWRYYPRLAWAWLACSLLLPVLLIGLSYHFVSDVIAGTYAAMVIYATVTTPQALAFWRIPPAGIRGR